MKVSVYSIKKILFQGEAISVACNTAMGRIVVLSHHEPLISVLAKGAMKVIDAEKKEHFFDITSGFLQMTSGNELRCIVE